MTVLQHQHQFEKFRSLIESVKTGILITRSTGDQLKGRSMLTVQVDEEGRLWFFTNEFSDNTKKISQNNEVFLTYDSPSENSYMVITGIASISFNREKMKELWNPLLRAWFPEGLETPGILLLKVEPEEVEYWDGSSGKIVDLFKMLSAMVSEKEYEETGHKKFLSVSTA
jgi:general stress protein 26